MGKNSYPVVSAIPGKRYPRVQGDSVLPSLDSPEFQGYLDQMDVFGHSHDYRYLVGEARPNLVSSFERMFGDGRDGNLVVSGGTTDLGSVNSVQFNNLELQNTGVLTADGPFLMIGVKGTLTIYNGGVIDLAGLPGADAISGFPAPGGAGKGGHGGRGGHTSGGGFSVGGGVAGHPFATAGQNSNAGQQGGSVVAMGWPHFLAAGGGGGGNGAGGGGGGYGGNGASPTAGNGLNSISGWTLNFDETTLKGFHSIYSAGGHFGWGGGGGGGIATSGSSPTGGGGGGGGGGALYIEAARVAIDSFGSTIMFDASGGNGGQGYSNSVTGASGGGGGGGGTIMLIGGAIVSLGATPLLNRMDVLRGSRGANWGSAALAGYGGYGFKSAVDLSKLPL